MGSSPKRDYNDASPAAIRATECERLLTNDDWVSYGMCRVASAYLRAARQAARTARSAESVSGRDLVPLALELVHLIHPR